MKSFFLFTILSFSFAFYCCTQKQDAIVVTEIAVKDSVVIDTTTAEIDTNQYLYDFIRIVEKDQKLDYSYGLSLDVETSLHNNDDEAYLSKFIKTTALKHVYYSKPPYSKDSTKLYNTDSSLSFKVAIAEPLILNPSPLFPSYECLTKGDVKHMLAEKRRLKNFSWNNQRLGFNLANKNSWYAFSLPYFSKDKKTTLISVRSLCPGLCGNGYVLLYQFQNNEWTSTQVDFWIH
jgi:hypothetical protein